MLMLSRRVGETIVIGGDAVVSVRAVTGNRVLIGVTAPQAIRVLRGELKPFDDDVSDGLAIPPAPARRSR